MPAVGVAATERAALDGGILAIFLQSWPRPTKSGNSKGKNRLGHCNTGETWERPWHCSGLEQADDTFNQSTNNVSQQLDTAMHCFWTCRNPGWPLQGIPMFNFAPSVVLLRKKNNTIEASHCCPRDKCCAVFTTASATMEPRKIGDISFVHECLLRPCLPQGVPWGAPC